MHKMTSSVTDDATLNKNLKDKVEFASAQLVASGGEDVNPLIEQTDLKYVPHNMQMTQRTSGNTNNVKDNPKITEEGVNNNSLEPIAENLDVVKEKHKDRSPITTQNLSETFNDYTSNPKAVDTELDTNSESTTSGNDNEQTEQLSLGSCDIIFTASDSTFGQAITDIREHLFPTHINPIPNDFEMVTDVSSVSIEGAIPQTPSNLVAPCPDNSLVISNSNAIPQSDSILSSNYSLSQLKCYGSNESLLEQESQNIHTYRNSCNEIINLSEKDSDSDSSSTSSSTSVNISDSSDSESESNIEYTPSAAATAKPLKVKGELELSDLPPIEDLTISVSEEECKAIGEVFQIVDQLVVIRGFKDRPALNLDSVLFLKGGKPLGKIFDVFGPVTEPHYCVRFNSREHIERNNIYLNQTIYCAPKTEYTNYIFLAQLLKLKGSDASWKDDIEPPTECLDYSDDEQEKQAKKNARAARNKNNVEAGSKPNSDTEEPARKKHFSYEMKMNKRNLQLSAARNVADSMNSENLLWDSAQGVNSSENSNVPHQIFGRPPVFNSIANFGRFPPGQGTLQQRQDTFPPRPKIFQPRTEFCPPRSNSFQPRPNDKFSNGLGMFPLRQSHPIQHPPTKLSELPNPFDSFRPTPQQLVQMFPPTLSQGPLGNNQSYSPFGLRFQDNSNQPNPGILQGPLENTQSYSLFGSRFQDNSNQSNARISQGPLENTQSYTPFGSRFHNNSHQPNTRISRGPLENTQSYSPFGSRFQDNSHQPNPRISQRPLENNELYSPFGSRLQDNSNQPRPRISPFGPIENTQTYSPLGFQGNSNQERQRTPYPNCSRSHPVDLWAQGFPQSTYFWPPPQPDRPPRPPPPNPL